MPSGYDMAPEDDLYRAILEFEIQPHEYKDDPVSGRRVYVPLGPLETKEKMIGPYKGTRPIKAYVTRNRNNYHKNLRIKRVEKVSVWEEVDI